MSSQISWHSLSTKKVLAEVKSTTKGLTEAEAKKRLKRNGLNVLVKGKKLSGLKIFFLQFHNALIYILIIAGIFSFILGDVVDAEVIGLAVIIQVVMGFIQEYKANQALAALAEVIHPRARVLRGGRERQVAVEEIVIGDVIVLTAGDKVPADIRILNQKDLHVNEAVLTGESETVQKQDKPVSVGSVLGDRFSLLYSSTLITEGSARGVVIATGQETAIGEIAMLLRSTREGETPLQSRLNNFSKQIAAIIVIVSCLVFFFGLMNNYDLTEMISLSVALAVAAIPEGLVIGMTVVLTVGMRRILKRHGLVRALQAAETLGSTTVICTDKTGTLTLGQMRLTEVMISGKLSSWSSGSTTINGSQRLLQLAALCNDAVVDGEALGSPTEKALLLAALDLGLTKIQLDKEYPRLDTVPFTSDRKYMITLHQQRADQLAIIKGAAEVVIAASNYVLTHNKVRKMTVDDKAQLLADYQAMSKKGLRVLACAYRQSVGFKGTLDQKSAELSDYIFAGLLGLQDSIRPEARATIQQASQAGIRTVMITGDNILTARSIAKQLGLIITSNNIVEGKELDTWSDQELKKRVKDIIIYARVTPKDKLRIVRAWQARGEIVAMTGDGINDAPALKAATIGVALGSGSEVAKETADLVLLDDNFQTIVTSVQEGRVIFDNIKKVILYLMAGSFSEVIVIMVALFMSAGQEVILPLLATQILWLNLVKDGFVQLALTVEPEEAEVMNRKPRSHLDALLGRESIFLVCFISLTSGLGALGVFWVIWSLTADIVMAQTATFAALGTATLAYVFSLRNLRQQIWRYNIFSNWYLNVAVVVSFALQLAAIYLPWLQNLLGTTALNVTAWKFIALYVILIIMLIESIKMFFSKSKASKSHETKK